MNDESKYLPRRDLRESYCRRYEEIIARVAKHGGFELDPKTVGTGRMNAGTFIMRFGDAMLGFEKYKYPSSKIPKSFDRKDIKCYETIDGMVAIVNRTMQKVAMVTQTASNEILPCSTESINLIVNYFGKPEGKGKFAVEMYCKIECANQDEGDNICMVIQEQRPDLIGEVNAARGWVTISKRSGQA